MALSESERIENEVRTRLQAVLARAGMDEEGVAKEVLFWLPDDFLAYYRDLFLRCLVLAESTPGNGKDDGRLIAKVPGRLRGTAKGLAAHGGGKRYRQVWSIRDEKAMEEKRRVDRGLRKLMEREGGRRSVMESDTKVAGRGETPGENGRDRSQGEQGGYVERVMSGGKARRIHRGCGRVMSDDWSRCPFCID